MTSKDMPDNEGFGARLCRAIDQRGPLCVGLDPHPSLLSDWGLSDDIAGLETFCETVVTAVGPVVAAVKPQSAFFERFGSKGISILESIIRQLAALGALTILDVKRGDIGSTVAAYASAYVDAQAPLSVDAVTASPYLGVGALRPLIDLAGRNGRGVFILAMTSNPEAIAVQGARGSDGRTVAEAVIDEIAQLNAGVTPIGWVGAVVGATLDHTVAGLTEMNGPVLVPGLGEQGGRPADLPKILGGNHRAVLPSYSRQILRGGPTVAGVRAAASRAVAECARVLDGKT